MRIRPDDPLSQNRMVDSQRRLYNLGLFNEVDMAVQNPEGIEPSKDVLFNHPGIAALDVPVRRRHRVCDRQYSDNQQSATGRPASVRSGCWKLRA